MGIIKSILDKIKGLRTFRGVDFKPFLLNLNSFSGYSITVLSVGWTMKGKLFMIGNSWCLLHIGLHNSIDSSFVLSLNIFGFLKKWFIKPRIINICPNCNQKIDTYAPIDNEVYCEECESWIHINEIKIVKLYREGKL